MLIFEADWVMCHWIVISVFIRIIITMPHIRWLWHNSLIRISGVGSQPTTILRYPPSSASLYFCLVLLIFCPPFPFNCAPCCSLTGSRYCVQGLFKSLSRTINMISFSICALCEVDNRYVPFERESFAIIRHPRRHSCSTFFALWLLLYCV